MSSTGEPRTCFVIEAAQGQNYRYICGACGASLSDHATSELLDCVFHCADCGTVNDPPVEHTLSAGE
jgi:DNA-directed RNA polymerase subunit RPC12/RpoP